MPGIGVIVWQRSKTGGNQHIFHCLPRHMHSETPELLHDLGVAKAGLVADTNDRIANLIIRSWAAVVSKAGE